MRNTSGLRPWQPGQSGNPAGRAKTKPVTDAILARMKRSAEVGDGKTLEDVIEVLIDCAKSGQQWAVQELLNRVEGRPPTVVVGDDDADPVTVRTIVTGVPRNGD